MMTDQGIQTKYQGDGMFTVGDKTVSGQDLENALRQAGGPTGNFTVNGEVLTVDKAFPALRKLAMNKDGGTSKPSPPAPSLSKGIIDITIVLQQMQMESGESLIKSGVTTVKSNQAKNESLHQEKMEKLNERIDDLEKAAAKEKKAGVWGKVAKAFEIIGAAIAFAIGAALVATGVGTAAGIAMMAISVLLIANSIADMAVGGSALAKGFEAAGMDPKAAMALSMALTIALNIGLAAASGGGSVAMSAASASANTATRAAGMAASVGVKTANLTSNIVGATGSLTTGIGSGVNNIQSAKARKEAEYAGAVAKEIALLMKMIQQKNEQETELIQGLVEQINDSISRVMSIISGVGESQQNIASKMGAMA